MALHIQKVLKSSSINLVGLRYMSSKVQNLSDVPSNNLHLALNRDYPKAEVLAMPPNIDMNETTRFSPLRNRDITSSAMSIHQEISDIIDVTLEQSEKEVKTEEVKYDDAHLRSYDKQTPVNLSSVMQTLVPEPFVPPPLGDDSMRSSYLSYPGGSWGQQTKYLSCELNSSHYTQLREQLRSDWSYKGGINVNNLMYSRFSCLLNHNTISINPKRFISLSSLTFNNESNQKPTQETTATVTKESGPAKLKKAIKEYGSTVIVFHVGISLISLGFFYTLVSSGLDVMAMLEKLNLADKLPKIAENASTFLIAYGVHKLFAPVRISITLFSTPFIVKYLRRKRILK